MDATAADELGTNTSSGYWHQQSYHSPPPENPSGANSASVSGHSRPPPSASEPPPPHKKIRSAAAYPQNANESTLGKDYDSGNGDAVAQTQASYDAYGAGAAYWYGAGSAATDTAYAVAASGGWYAGYAPGYGVHAACYGAYPGTSYAGYGVNAVGYGANPGMAANTSYGGYNSGYAAAPPGVNDGYGASGTGRGSTFTSRMFYKTKLCTKFSSGACTFGARCNFAHGMEEIRRPPSSWEGVRVSQGSDGYGGGQSSDGKQHGPPSKTRLCRIFYSERNCPYGDTCSFLHDIQGLQPTPAKDVLMFSGSMAGGLGQGGMVIGQGGDKPPNWKTKICKSWEATGQCSFGENCHFAHGPSELKPFGRGPGGAYHSSGNYAQPNLSTASELPAFEVGTK